MNIYDSFTDDGTVAQIALCFMIKSLTSKYRDMVTIYPMQRPLDTCKAETVSKRYNEVMEQVHKMAST